MLALFRSIVTKSARTSSSVVDIRSLHFENPKVITIALTWRGRVMSTADCKKVLKDSRHSLLLRDVMRELVLFPCH